MKAQERYPYKCLRCGWQWFSTMVKPNVCPKCHNVYWNIPRKEKVEVAAVEAETSTKSKENYNVH